MSIHNSLTLPKKAPKRHLLDVLNKVVNRYKKSIVSIIQRRLKDRDHSKVKGSIILAGNCR